MEKLSFSDIRKAVAEHLKTARLGVEEFAITYAEHQETQQQWKISVEYKKVISGIAWPISAALLVDDATGEVKQFMEGRVWA